MNEDALTTVNALKTAHAERVLAKLAELKAEIAGEADLWFGGNPPLFEEVDRFIEHRSGAIRQTFGLGLNEA